MDADERTIRDLMATWLAATQAGDWAYAWTQLTVRVTPRAGGDTHVRSGPTLSVLHKVGGRWFLHRDANLLAPAPA